MPHVLRQGRRLHSGRGLRCGHPEETEGRECELLSPPLSACLNVTMLEWDEGRSGWRIHQLKAKRITFHSYYHILVHCLFACCLIPPTPPLTFVHLSLIATSVLFNLSCGLILFVCQSRERSGVKIQTCAIRWSQERSGVELQTCTIRWSRERSGLNSQNYISRYCPLQTFNAIVTFSVMICAMRWSRERSGVEQQTCTMRWSRERSGVELQTCAMRWSRERSGLNS